MLSQYIDEFRITSALTVLQSHHRESRQERNAFALGTIETSRQHHRLLNDADQLMFRGANSCASRESECNRFPQFDAVFVVLLRKLRNRKMMMLVHDGGFRACAPERRARCENQLQIFICFLVAKNSFGDLKQAPEFDESRHTDRSGRLEYLVARFAKAQCAEA